MKTRWKRKRSERERERERRSMKAKRKRGRRSNENRRTGVDREKMNGAQFDRSNTLQRLYVIFFSPRQVVPTFDVKR